MKVLLYLPTPGGLTGAPRRLLNLAKVLREHGFGVCIACDAESELSLAAKELAFEVQEISPIGVLKRRGSALFGGGLFFRLLTAFSLLLQNLVFCWRVRSSHADVVWIRASKGIAFAGFGAMLSRRPLIWDVDYELPSQGLVRWLHRFGLWASKAVVFQYRAAPDGIFGQKLAHHYRYKFHSIIPGINLLALASPYKMRKKRCKSEDDNFVILQVGTVCDRKNQMFLLDALKQLPFEDLSRKVRVLLAGGLSDQAYVEQVKSSIQETGLGSVVELCGWRTDVHALMAEADLLVMPSKDEGVPNTVQEAMYLGLPVLVSDNGGMPEIVVDGETGWVLPLNSSCNWAKQIRYCMERPQSCTKIGVAASTYAEKYFSTRSWGHAYSQIIVESNAG
ncbi:glycosyltransferase family 4 protein [Halomonas sp. TBZ9]|uniref:Glycosyltransferase family 4 protein n=1 Tax=Vreelandella azerica TaxID=2732867 RepID=A0A7Y3TWX8_9GAMM|nr:glycosyltransferase family 4 protein [Halomonas azerica]NOG31688.1 glycosyltransferase family 4 protein [Halomonas azerica]